VTADRVVLLVSADLLRVGNLYGLRLAKNAELYALFESGAHLQNMCREKIGPCFKEVTLGLCTDDEAKLSLSKSLPALKAIVVFDFDTLLRIFAIRLRHLHGTDAHTTLVCISELRKLGVGKQFMDCGFILSGTLLSYPYILSGAVISAIDPLV
jgi:hypothetical protein